MKLEAEDSNGLWCVATISKVKGDELLIHFDGWSTDQDYWCQLDSIQIHPVGWCEENGRELEEPHSESEVVWQKKYAWNIIIS